MDPAAIMARSPIVTPSTIMTWDPTHTSSPITMPFDVSGCLKTQVSGSSIVWLKARIDVCAPMRTASPRVISPRTTVNGLIVQFVPVTSVPVTYAWPAMYELYPRSSRSVCTAAISEMKHRSAMRVSGSAAISCCWRSTCRCFASSSAWSQKNHGE